MGPWVVCDEQLLYAESLASALRRRGADRVTAVASLPPQLTVGTIIVSVRGAEPDLACLRQMYPAARLVYLTSGDPDSTRRVLGGGADEVLTRDSGLEEVLRALDPDDAAAPVARRRAETRTPVPLSEAHLRFLTFRERETLDLLVAAKSTEMIAAEMHITTATARGYVQSILEKLCVHSRLEAVAYAARHASVPLDQAWCSW